MGADDNGISGTNVTTRRRVIGGIVAGAVAVAGCLDEGAEDPDDAGAAEDEGTAATGDSMDAETAATDTEATETADEAASASFQERIRFEESYAVTGTTTFDGETADIEGRFHSEDWYLRIETNDGTFELYLVDGDTYQVSDEQCFKNAQQDFESDGADPATVRSDAEELPDLTPDGRTTIDGEAMIVYEFDDVPGDSSEGTQTVKYYVSAETGYPRRIEGEFGVLNFHSWGDVDPIEAPDMACESY